MSTLSVRAGLVTPSFTLDVAFEAPPGVTVLFGPSGAGKSRTLACIAGLVRPDTGRIALGEDTWLAIDPRSGVRSREVPIHARRVAYVFQSLALFPHLSALDNVAYGIPRAVAAADRRDQARAMLERMRVGHLAGRFSPTFSGGEAQRVALARAFAMQPRVLLLDEPFSALDTEVKHALLDEVAAWVEREQLPTLLVTHQRDEAEAIGQRVVRIEAGRITAQGSIATLGPGARGEAVSRDTR